MPQTKILVDTCSYLRLAQNLHPLLARTFGSKEYALYVNASVTEEFERQARLQNKFDWFTGAEFVADRSRPLNISRKAAKGIDDTYDFMWAHVQDEELGPSPVDVRVLATASELGIAMVTDDTDLLDMAALYGVHAMNSLELLRLMADEKHIDMDLVHRVVAQWRYDGDTPAKFDADYRRLFGEAPPAG